MTESLLGRLSSTSITDSPLSTTQEMIDRAVGSFAQEMTNAQNLLAMTLGSSAFRLTRLGLESLGVTRSLGAFAPLVQSSLALGVEVTAFRGTHQLLQSRSSLLGSDASVFHPQAWLSSYIDFALLKGMGHLFQGQNLVLTHLSQSGSMVLGHQMAFSLGLAARPEGNIFDQWVQAEVSNLALSAGASLFARLAPRLNAFERSLNLSHSIQNLAHLSETSREFSLPQLAPALAGSVATPSKSIESHQPHMMMMEGSAGSSHSSGPRGVSSEHENSLPALVRPERGYAPLPTSHPVSRPRSSAEAIDRTRNTEQDLRQLSYLRWAEEQLARHPEKTREQFRSLMTRIFETQEVIQAKLNPLLESFPTPDYRPLNEAAAHYLRALREFAPGSVQALGESLHLLERTKELRTVQDFQNLGLERLDILFREIGIEPDTILSLRRNLLAFERSELFEILNQSTLREIPETQSLRDALENHDAKNPSPLQNATDSFFNDPLRARIFRFESAKYTALIRALQEIPESTLRSWLSQNFSSLTGERRAAAERFFETADAVKTFQPPNLLGKALDLWRGGEEKQQAQRLLGSYEEVFFRLLGHLTTPERQAILEHHANLGGVNRSKIFEVTSSSRHYYETERRLQRQLRQSFETLENQNQDLWAQIDSSLYGSKNQVGLIEADIAFQHRQVEDHLRHVIDRIGIEAFYQRPYVREFLSKAATRHEKSIPKGANNLDPLFSFAREGVKQFIIRAQSSRVPSILTNRQLFTALQEASFLRHLTRRALREEQIEGSDFTVLSPLMAPVSEKLDHSRSTAWTESVLSALPHLQYTARAARQAVKQGNNGASSVSIDEILLDQATTLQQKTNSTYVVNPEVDHIVEMNPLVEDASHASWQGDFFDGSIPAARAAQLKGRHSYRDILRVLAKADLVDKIRDNPMIHPRLASVIGTLAQAVTLFTEPVGSQVVEYEEAITRGARSMALGHIPGHRAGPRSAGVFSELTMPLFSILNPFVFDPFPACNGMMSPPGGGRSFAMSDRAMALTGRTGWMLLSNVLGGYYLDPPKPDTFLPRRDISLRTVTELWPTWALIDPQRSPDDRKSAAQGNWLRTLWWLSGITPEYAPQATSLQKRFTPFDNVRDLTIERNLENRFGNRLGIYPSAEKAAEIRAQIAGIEERLAQLDPTRDVVRTTQLRKQLSGALRARDIYETRMVELRLLRAQREIQEVRATLQDARPSDRLMSLVQARLNLLSRVAKKLGAGHELNLSERSEWAGLREALLRSSPRAQANQTLAGLSQIRETLNHSSLPLSQVLSAKVEEAIAAYRLTIARVALGETLSPAEEVRAESLEASFTGAAYSDPFIDAIRNHPQELTLERLNHLLAEQEIRSQLQLRLNQIAGEGRGHASLLEVLSQNHPSDAVDLRTRVEQAPRQLGRLFSRSIAEWFPQMATHSPALLRRGMMHLSNEYLQISPNTWRQIEAIYLESARTGRPLEIQIQTQNAWEVSFYRNLFPDAIWVNLANGRTQLTLAAPVLHGVSRQETLPLRHEMILIREEGRGVRLELR